MKRPMNPITLAAAAALLVAPTVAAARDVPPIYVAGADDNPVLAKCSLSTGALVAEMVAALKEKGVAVVNRDEGVNDKALFLMIDLQAMSLADITCVGNLSLRLGTVAKVPNPVTGESQSASLLYCDSGMLFSGASAQSSLTPGIRPWLDGCLAHYKAD